MKATKIRYHLTIIYRLLKQFCILYWNFLDDKKQYFVKNNSMSMILRLLEKIPAGEFAAIKERADNIIKNPDAY